MGEQIFIVAQWVLLGGILLLFLPIRRQSRFVTTRLLKATPQQVWDMLVDFPEFGPDTLPRHPVFPETLISYRKVQDDPVIFEAVSDASKGQRTALITIRSRVLARGAPWHVTGNYEEINGKPFPLGEDAFAEYQFEAVPEGTRASHILNIRTQSLFHSLAARRSLAVTLDRAKDYFENGKATRKPASLLGWQRSLGLTVLACGSFALAFGWEFGIGLALVLLLHEFGHWATMRLLGYRGARMTLLPFLGGVATAGQPYKTQLHAALCTLMGPGFSAILCGLMVFTAMAVSGTAQPNHIVLSPVEMNDNPFAQLLTSTAAFIAIFNLFQLLPVVPLDGGQILRNVIPPGKYDVQRWSTIIIAAITCVVAVWLQQYLFVPLALIGLAIFARATPPLLSQVPMTWRGRVGIIAGTLAVLLVLAGSSANLISGIVGLENPWRRLAYAAGLMPTLPGAEGSNMIEPAFRIRTPFSSGLPAKTWVVGGNWHYDRREWRIWGKLTAPEPDIQVSVLDTSGETRQGTTLGNLRGDLRDALALEDAELIFAPPGTRVMSRLGAVDSEPFTAATDDFTKPCRSFHAYLAAGNAYVSGYVCAARGGAVSDHDIVCLMDSLDLPSVTGAVPAATTGCLATLTPPATSTSDPIPNKS